MATILNFPNGRVRNDAPRSAPVTHRSFAPADLRKWTRDKDAGALVEWATPVLFTPSQPTFGERLVLFFRLNGEALTFWFAMVTVGLLLSVVIGAYAARLS